MDLLDIRKKVNHNISQYKTTKNMFTQEKENLKKSTIKLDHEEQAQEIIQLVSQAIQQQAHKQIAQVVAQCLKAVFYDEDYGFKILFEKKRGKTEAKLIITNQGYDVDKPLEMESGGVLDVASFALRLSCLMLTKPKLRRVIIMDEPFKNVSIEYQPNTKALLEQLTEDFGIQIIMVTHETGFKCGKVIQLC